MQERLKSWRHFLWQRNGWFIPILFYKIVEDWALGRLTQYAVEHRGFWLSMSDIVIEYLPWITWIAIPIIVSVLIIKAWLDSAKLQPVSTLNTSRPQLMQDSVLWENGGRDGYGNIHVIGPLCPKDYTPLARKDKDKIDTHLKYNILISDSGYHSQLICPECNGEYILGPKPKTVGDSRDQVDSRFQGREKAQPR